MMLVTMHTATGNRVTTDIGYVSRHMSCSSLFLQQLPCGCGLQRPASWLSCRRHKQHNYCVQVRIECMLCSSQQLVAPAAGWMLQVLLCANHCIDNFKKRMLMSTDQ
jgi:hypothetical protein